MKKMKNYETKKEIKSGEIIRLNLKKGERLYDFVSNLKTLGKGFQTATIKEILADACEGEPLSNQYLNFISYKEQVVKKEEKSKPSDKKPDDEKGGK